jgi:hypothetical protein
MMEKKKEKNKKIVSLTAGYVLMFQVASRVQSFQASRRLAKDC